ncbi:MAG: GNAT family N-acetyltransferase [Bacteroidetes bacterium]|nr:GNAT family N-acetyltransferase [Bacteroidota bacterium]
MINYRKIVPQDSAIITEVILSVMKEFKDDMKGTIAEDPTVHTMYENFQKEKSVYYIAEEDGNILGGAGISRLDGSPENICELQRMFLLPEARGKGTGSKLMEMCMDAAKNFGYEKIYLETLDNMNEARKLYLKSGFEFISSPLGNTGHCGCNTWMVLEL